MRSPRLAAAALKLPVAGLGASRPLFQAPLTGSAVSATYAGRVRAVVVGAGIGGLAAAIALDQAGVERIVLERAPALREAGFGLVVSANAVTALRSLGLREGVAARGTRVRRAEIRNPRGDLLTRIDYEALGWETYGILRSELQQAMLERCRATTCASGRRVSA
jgi:2-polyprenyl-6-methoxyphenol hydroxylase-like FAD-dependent oxidoreductase